MTSNFKYKISLRIQHPTLDPNEICRELELEAACTQKAGSSRRTPKGRPLQGVYKSSYCSFRLEHSESASLSSNLREFNQRFLRHQEFFNRLVESGGLVEYFIGWFSESNNSGEVFDWQLLKECADLRINLALDVYDQRFTDSATPPPAAPA